MFRGFRRICWRPRVSRRKELLRIQLVLGVCFIAFFSLPTAGEELKGKYTPDQVKGSCDKAGGEYFPQGRSGTYGCENHKNGNMVLCNKENKCTGYVATRTAKETENVMRDLKLNAAQVVR